MVARYVACVTARRAGCQPPIGPSAAGEDSYAVREPQTLATGQAQREPSESIRTVTVSAGTDRPTTRPAPSGVSTRSPTAGADSANEAYSGCSYFRQHIKRPHAPEMR